MRRPAHRFIVFATWLVAAAIAAGASPNTRGGAPPGAQISSAVLDDVEASFAALSSRGESLTAVMSGLIPRPAYRATASNGFGVANHFQGIQRVGNYIVISGADAHAPAADLFVARLESDTTAALIGAFTLEDAAWHAGGIAVEGTTLAVPFYGAGGEDRQSRVRFYDLSDPTVPVQLPVAIERPARKAIAVALTRLRNSHWLVAVLSGRDGLPRRLDLYLSRSTDLTTGFGDPLGWQTAFVSARNGQAPSFSHFQNINFLRQGDGRLYLIGFHNTFVNIAALPGRDYADLYEVVLPESLSRDESPMLGYPRVVKVANKRLTCGAGCSLDAAAGAHVDPVMRALSIYATPGWIGGDTLRLTRYTEAIAGSKK